MASYSDYKSIKDNNHECLVFVKSGVFYETYDKDCKIMLDIFNYQIKNFKNFNRTGFPSNNINKVVQKLSELSINYIIIDKSNINQNFFESNNYNFYLNKKVNKKVYSEKYKTNFHENLQLANEFKLTLKYIEKTIEVFPKSEKVLKDRMINSLYDILELIYTCNCITDRQIYQAKIISKLKMLDFYLSQSLEKGYLNFDKYNKCGIFLIKLVNLTEAWMLSKNEKKK